MTAHASARTVRPLAAAAATAALLVASTTSARLVKYGLATVDLSASGPGGAAVEGSTHDVRVADDGTTITLTAGLASLRTGVDVADDQMRKALEVDKCPTAVLVVPRSAMRFPTSAPTSGAVRGTLRLHCQTRPVTLTYTATRSGELIDAKGAMHLDMREFGIVVPVFWGLRAQPWVTVRAAFRARDV